MNINFWKDMPQFFFDEIVGIRMAIQFCGLMLACLFVLLLKFYKVYKSRK